MGIELIVTCPYCKKSMPKSQMDSHHFIPCDVMITDPEDLKKKIKCNDLEHAGCQH